MKKTGPNTGAGKCDSNNRNICIIRNNSKQLLNILYSKVPLALEDSNISADKSGILRLLPNTSISIEENRLQMSQIQSMVNKGQLVVGRYTSVLMQNTNIGPVVSTAPADNLLEEFPAHISGFVIDIILPLRFDPNSWLVRNILLYLYLPSDPCEKPIVNGIMKCWNGDSKEDFIDNVPFNPDIKMFNLEGIRSRNDDININTIKNLYHINTMVCNKLRLHLLKKIG